MKLPALQNKTVAVVGCGGLGTNVIAHLAGEGVGTLKFCDFDTVSQSNLDRQFLYRQSDVGKKKTDLIAAFLRSYAPDVKCVPVDKKIEVPLDLAFAEDADLLFLCADNNAVRKTAEVFCKTHSVPLLSGGVSGHYGVVYLYIPGKSPSLTEAGLLDAETGNIVSVSSAVGIIGALAAEIGSLYLETRDAGLSGTLYVYDRGEIKPLPIKKRS